MMPLTVEFYSFCVAVVLYEKARVVAILFGTMIRAFNLWADFEKKYEKLYISLTAALQNQRALIMIGLDFGKKKFTRLKLWTTRIMSIMLAQVQPLTR